jgi:hypothetical protein
MGTKGETRLDPDEDAEGLGKEGGGGSACGEEAVR